MSGNACLLFGCAPRECERPALSVAKPYEIAGRKLSQAKALIEDVKNLFFGGAYIEGSRARL